MKTILMMMFGAAATIVTSATALELPKGAKLVADTEAGAIFINRKLKLTIYNTKTGEKIGGGALHHRPDGVKMIDITVNDKKIRRNLKWSMKNGRFCGDSLALDKRICGTGGMLYKLGGTCYNSRDGKRVAAKFKC